MSILSVIQDACLYLGIDKPDAVYGQDSRTTLELAEIANDQAAAIMKAHDWELLTTLATMTGDGSTEDFAVPADYDRMVDDSRVWGSALETPFRHIISRDEWLGLDIRSFDFVVNAWIKYGGEVHIKPALANAATAKYWYISNKVVVDSGSTTKAAFTDDTDTFRISERLIKLAIIWSWKKAKGQAYQEEMVDYQTLLEKLITTDAGARTLRIGRARGIGGVRTAYPQSISG